MKDFVTKNRYLTVLRDIHLPDNMSLDSSDTYYNVREYFNFLNPNFNETQELDHNLNLNVLMVSFTTMVDTVRNNLFAGHQYGLVISLGV